MSAEPLTANAVADTGAVDAENPWPGLAAFREVDQEFFHGRGTETEELFRLVLRDRLAVLYGLSGLGKTSLLQAGLFPRLRQENVLPVRIRLDFSENHIPLAAQVKAAIVKEALDKGVEAPTPRPSETLWELFHRQGADFWNSRNRLVTPLLAFDQFEEIFTLGCKDAETGAFLDEIASLAEGSPPESVRTRLDDDPDEARTFSFSRHPYKILLSLREDFLPDLEELRGRMRSIGSNRLRLQRMSGANALKVVTRAGERLIAPDAAERVVRFVAGRPEEDQTPLESFEVEPALLSVVCRELNNKRRVQKESRITADLLKGNRDEILSDFYRRSVEDLDGRVRTFIEESLLTVSGFRDSVALENALRTPGVTQEAIDKLTDRRLLRIEDRGGVERLELTHDVLTGVIRASRDRRREQEALQQAEAARQEAEERERKTRKDLERQNRILVLVSVLLAAVVILGLWGYVQQRAGQKARSVSDLGVSASLRDDQSNKALAYLARSLRTDSDNFAARTWITDMLLRRTWPVPVLEIREEGGLISAELSPDGQRLLTTAITGKVQTWDAKNGQRIGSPIQAQGFLSAARFSPDGTRIVTIGLDGTKIWEAQTGKLIADLEINAFWGSADFSPDGSILVILDSGRIMFWDVQTGKLNGTLANDTESSLIDALARFSPDGLHLLTIESNWHTDEAILWELATGKIKRTLLLPSSWNIEDASLSRDGRLLAIASQEGTGQIWDVFSGQTLGEPFEHGAPINSISFSQKNETVVTASEDRTARVWDARTGLPLTEPLQHASAVKHARFSPDGRQVITASSDGTARLWEIQRGQSDSELLQVGEIVTLSPDASRIASFSGHQISVQELPSGRIIGSPIRLTRPVEIRFSNDGNHLITVEKDPSGPPPEDGLRKKVRVWKIETGRAIGRTTSVKGDLFFSEDGYKAAVLSKNNFEILDLKTGRIFLENLPSHGLVRFSPNGRRMIIPASETTSRIWNLETATPIGEALQYKSRETTIAFSPGDLFVVLSDNGATAQIWNSRSGTPEGKPLYFGPGFNVNRVQFSPDSRFFLASGFGRVSALDLSGKVLGTRLLIGPIQYNGISNDGEVVATFLNDSFYLWQPKNGELLADPFEEGRDVDTPELRPDGRIFYAVAETFFLGSSVHAWELAAGTAEDVETLASLAETAAGLRLDKDGRLVPLENWIARIDELRKLPSDDDPLSAASLARWFFADRFTRTLSPLSKISLPDHIRHSIARGKEAREEVLKAYPDHPLVIEELSRSSGPP